MKCNHTFTKQLLTLEHVNKSAILVRASVTDLDKLLKK